MNTKAIPIEMKSELSAIREAIDKLITISDVLPVTVSNFVAGAGGMPGLIAYDISQDEDKTVWFIARPNEKMLRFLDMFDADDLTADSSAHAICGCTSKEMALRIASQFREGSRQGGWWKSQ